MTPVSELEAATAVERVGELRYRAGVPDGWQQGRGAFGGLVLGTLLRAIERSEPDANRRVRTVAGDLCGPVLPGPADIQVRVLRRGANQSNLVAELSQGGAVLATVNAVLSPPRPSVVLRTGLAAPSGEWRTVEPFSFEGDLWPPFARHFEYRMLGPLPFGGGEVAECHGWVRERTTPARLDAPAVVAWLDAWWPTLFSVDTAPRPCATIQFTAELLADPASLDPSRPLRYRGTMVAMREGFFLESRELWDGEALVALNQQTFAILR